MLLKYFTNLAIICLCLFACNTKVPNSKAHTDESNSLRVQDIENSNHKGNTLVIRSNPIQITEGGQTIEHVEITLDTIPAEVKID